MSADPIGEACRTCQLYLTHAGPTITQATLDSRPGPYPYRVLVLTGAPTAVEAYTGRLLNDDSNSWVLDYLNEAGFEWVLSSVLLCSIPTDPWGKTIKQTPKKYQGCSTAFLLPLLEKYQPHAILSLGGEPLKAVWPETRGACPSITKARMAPIQLDELPGRPWLLCTYDARLHGWWLDSSGRKGQDLTEEYIRVFELLTNTLEGGYSILHPDWKLVSTLEEIESFSTYLAVHAIDELILDTENASWIGRGIRPWKVDPEGMLPSRLTPWHEDNELLCFGITIVRDGRYESFEICVDELDGRNADIFLSWVRQVFHGRRASAWNNISDFQDLFLFLGLVIGTDYLCGDDGFLLRGLRNSSLTDNNLKTTVGELLVYPDWSEELDASLDLAKDVRGKAGLPRLSCMADIPREVTLDYNAHDHFYTAVLLREHLNYTSLGEDFPWVAYNELLDGLPWLLEIEQNGIPVDEALFNETLNRLEDEEAQLYLELRAYPEVQRAEARAAVTKMEKAREKGVKNPRHSPVVFNLRAPTFYNELILEMFGVEDGAGGYAIPEYFPRTATGLSSDKNTLAWLAGNEKKAYVPEDLKSPTQLFWNKCAVWKEAGDDFTKLRGLLDYVEDGVIHARCRILKTDTSDDGEEEGGTVSGRFSFSPNTGNLKKTRDYLAPFAAPPGWVWWRGDYGRAELVWLAFNSQDPLMMQWSMEGLDQHRERGAAIWGTTFKKDASGFEALDKTDQDFWRSKGKTQNFADVYCEEPETTARKLGVEVQDVIAALRQGAIAHPKVLELKMQVYDTCQRGGFVKSTLFGRRRSAVGWTPSPQTAAQFFSLEECHRENRHQMNASIFRSLWNTRAAQADSSDMTFCAGKLIHKRLLSGKWLDARRVKSINFIHDALDYLVREDCIEEARTELRQAMITSLGALPIHFPIPVPVDDQVGLCLGDFLK